MGRELHTSTLIGTALGGILCLLAACGQSPFSIAVSPSEINFAKVGATQQLEAEPRDRRGAKIADAVVTYRSRDSSVASVSSTGLVTAMKHGVTTLEIRVQDTEIMEFVRVIVRVPEKIEIRPRNSTVHIGGVQDMSAKVLDADGKVINNISIAWSTGDEKLLRMEKGGRAVGLDEGETTVIAEALGLKGVAKVRVAWAPGQKALIEQEKRFKNRVNRARRRNSGGSGGGGAGSDPRLGMFQ